MMLSPIYFINALFFRLNMSFLDREFYLLGRVEIFLRLFYLIVVKYLISFSSSQLFFSLLRNKVSLNTEEICNYISLKYSFDLIAYLNINESTLIEINLLKKQSLHLSDVILLNLDYKRFVFKLSKDLDGFFKKSFNEYLNLSFMMNQYSKLDYLPNVLKHFNINQFQCIIIDYYEKNNKLSDREKNNKTIDLLKRMRIDFSKFTIDNKNLIKVSSANHISSYYYQYNKLLYLITRENSLRIFRKPIKTIFKKIVLEKKKTSSFPKDLTVSVSHYDANPENFLITANSQILLDWDSLRIAPETYDISYFMGFLASDDIKHYLPELFNSIESDSSKTFLLWNLYYFYLMRNLSNPDGIYEISNYFLSGGKPFEYFNN